MGVLNVTPDSFSDGGLHLDPRRAIQHGLSMIDQGADLVDVGGESTRPGSDPVSAQEEWSRVGAVIEALSRKVDAPISVDTRKPEVAEKALGAGASVVNDTSGLRDARMIHVAAESRAGVIIMHMKGEPKTMQRSPEYSDVVAEVRAFLEGQVRAAVEGRVRPASIAIDPGIGFGKTLEHNLALLRNLGVVATLGHPVVVGVSRKSFLAQLGAGESSDGRLAGSLAAASLAVAQGAHIVRAHDVLETARAMRVVDALLRTGE